MSSAAIDDTAEALKDGADEIDLVMPWRALSPATRRRCAR